MTPIKPMYHGSNQHFDTFDIAKSHGMIWLTSNIEYAKQFGQPCPYNVCIDNPLDMSGHTQEFAIECWQDMLSDIGIDINNIDWDVVDFAPDYGYYYWYDLLPHAGNNYADAGTITAILDAGFDAVLAPEESCEGIKSGLTYIVFDTKNIKKEA